MTRSGPGSDAGSSALLPGAEAQTEDRRAAVGEAPSRTDSRQGGGDRAWPRSTSPTSIRTRASRGRRSVRRSSTSSPRRSASTACCSRSSSGRARKGGYELLGGERRLRASKLAGATRVPAIIRQVDDRQALEQAVVENVQRADLDPLEEASAYRNLIDLFELTQEDTARRVGKSRVHVTNMLRLLELPEEIKAFVADGRLQAGHARALLAFKDDDKRIAVARRAVDKGLTVRQIEELARTDGAERTTSEREPRKRRYPDLEESLADHLGTDVRIEAGRGKRTRRDLVRHRDDLHRIVELLLGY